MLKTLKNESGFVSSIVATLLLVEALFLFGTAVAKGVHFRKLAETRVSAADLAQKTLHTFLNLPWYDRYLREGNHPFKDEYPVDPELKDVKWTVSTQGPRLKKLSVFAKAPEAGSRGVIGYKYDDF